jgi:hypothetical protein
MGVATSMGAAASAVGVPGFSMAPSAFPLIAGMGWSSRSSYFGQPEFRGVADMATHSNDLQRGWSPGFALGGGLGAFGIGVPAVGSGGYYIGPYPSFNPMEMFAWMYQQTFGQQPAGPVQAAAPQPASTQVDAKEGEKKAEDAGAGPTGRRRRGGGRRAAPLSAAEQARLQGLEAKKRNPIPFIGGLNAAEQAEYDALKRREGLRAGSVAPRPSGVGASGGPSGPSVSGPGAAAAGGGETPMSTADQQKLAEISMKTTPKTDAEKEFVAKMRREHPSFFRGRS